MKTIGEMFDKYNTKRRAKKFGRSFECQDYRDKLAKKIKEGKSDEELAKILGQEQGTIKYAEMISCGRVLSDDLANKLIDSGHWKRVKQNLSKFKQLDEQTINRIEKIEKEEKERKEKKERERIEKERKEREEKERKERERQKIIDTLKEIRDKFLEFGIEYTIDEKSLLLNIKGNIDERIFPKCYELGLFQYVEKIDGNLYVGLYGKTAILENLKCVNGDLVIGKNNCEAKELGVVNGNLNIYGSLKAPLKKISGDCDVHDGGSLPSNNLEYIGGELYLYKYTAPMGSTHGWVYFPVLRYVGGVELNGYYMGSNKSITIGDNKVYGGVIYFIDPDDPRLEKKVDVICDYLSRSYNRGLYDSIPTNKNYNTHINSIPVDRDYSYSE